MSSNAMRYCYLATLADWSKIEDLLLSSCAETAIELKNDLDQLIDAEIAGASTEHLRVIEEAMAKEAKP